MTNASAPNDEVPDDGPLLGVDYRTKRIGLAICTPEQSMAVPLENDQRLNETIDAAHFARVCEEYRIKGLVVGLPVHTDGGESKMSRQVRAYGEKLREWTDLPLTFWEPQRVTPERRRCSSGDEESMGVSAVGEDAPLGTTAPRAVGRSSSSGRSSGGRRGR